jgi:nucleolar protein 58
MLVLFETAAGYALFAADKGALKQTNLLDAIKKPEDASRLLRMQSFFKFETTADALKAATALTEGKMTKELKNFLKVNIVDKGIADTLAVADAKVTPLSASPSLLLL